MQLRMGFVNMSNATVNLHRLVLPGIFSAQQNNNKKPTHQHALYTKSSHHCKLTHHCEFV